ncbi:MAG: anaerobic glycerol-3-phosphate dehydrogenase subunit C, partial [Spirochaetes bacterium]|nr:anaerobic glycerol-3-phosphate dehydrogenase subunit C [Spirochaetota bacterium]
KAQSHGRHNIKVLSSALSDEKTKIVSASSSCTLALKHEYPNLLELDNSPILNTIAYITQFILEEFEKGNILSLQPLSYTVAYHSPCHLERMGSAAFTIELLRKIPALTVKILHSECCGISGTYGFKNEYYGISQSVGNELFRIIEEAKPDFVVTDCETCKWQIEMNTKYKVVHPISLLAEAIE